MRKNMGEKVVKRVLSRAEYDEMKKKCSLLDFVSKICVDSDNPTKNKHETARLYLMNTLLTGRLPGCGQNITVVDCEAGVEYHTHMTGTNPDLISAGLKDLWYYNGRATSMQTGDVIGVALDPENNHILYVDFNYRIEKYSES